MLQIPETAQQANSTNQTSTERPASKAHQAQVERLRLELARLQKANNDLSDQLEKQKKQKDSLELRVDELRKNANTDRAEIKDLGVKLRMSEHQRTQMTAKHGDFADMKKALKSLETRRKDELKERDKTIADLEKSLIAETKRREMAEGRLKETMAKHEVEIGRLKGTTETLKSQITSTHHELVSAQRQLEMVTSNGEIREKTHLQQLEDHRMMLSRVSEQFSMLASNTVPKTSYERFRFENAALQLQVARYSRKLGNTEGQVSELANLIRQSQEENQLLRRSMIDMEQELSCSHEYLALKTVQPPVLSTDFTLDDAVAGIGHDQDSFKKEAARITTENLHLEAELYRLQHQHLLAAYAEAETELQESAAIASKLPEVEEQRDMVQELLQATTVSLENLKRSSETLKRQVSELETKLKADSQKADDTLKKEQEAVHRLTITTQKLRMAEDGLRAENEQLTAELTDAERFQEAYYSLSEELEGLLARNALAEDEAQRLSKANAEILGHRNPAQRIMYVERIRNELAEARQNLLISTRTVEAMTTHNQDLQTELDMYKSVAVPRELKPSTKFTRMTRPPLADMNKSFVAHGNEEAASYLQI
ncbi:hypothetical protein GYMLUDRAFT_216977 [Collybiopsis luxurians FD-317 M1]|nr:hypothetical protein GYMLUDRAFT_216977 [Collybiopsis luxurians FD-317 M1]